MRRDFDPLLEVIHFHVVGGQCECTGCGLLFGHTGRCSARYRYEDRATADNVYGWQADHKNGIAWDNSLKNLRILCVTCHKQTPSYGRSHQTSVFGAPTPTPGLPSPTLLEALLGVKPDVDPLVRALSAYSTPPRPTTLSTTPFSDALFGPKKTF